MRVKFTENTPLISMIVPVYMVEKYLPKCLASIAAQTYPSLEVLLVDDGSPDESGKILDEFAAEHPNFRIIHQENAGVSAARNNALREAEGEYICYLDSDDIITEDYVEYLYKLLRDYKADISVGLSRKINEDKLDWTTSEPFPSLASENETVIELTPGETISRMAYNQDFSITIWGKLFRRKLVEAHPFPLNWYYEDLATTYKIVGDAEKIVFGNRPIHYWVQRSGSITHQPLSEKHFKALAAAEGMVDYCTDRYPEAAPAAKVRLAIKLAEFFVKNALDGGDKEVFAMLRESLLPIYSDVIKSSRLSFSVKMRLRAAKRGYRPTQLLAQMWRLK